MSYTYNPIYSHFQGDDISRIEKVERAVVQTILNSEVPDKDRSWGKVFELKHSSSCAQMGRILAQKRGLDAGISAVICALHDIYVFKTGRVTNHGPLGAPIAQEILESIGGFSQEEIEIITQAVRVHSDKHMVSQNPYAELVKDADVFDCGLYEGVHDAYVYEKAPHICKTYFDRIKKVREELALPYDAQWDSIELIHTHDTK